VTDPASWPSLAQRPGRRPPAAEVPARDCWDGSRRGTRSARPHPRGRGGSSSCSTNSAVGCSGKRCLYPRARPPNSAASRDKICAPVRLATADDTGAILREAPLPSSRDGSSNPGIVSLFESPHRRRVLLLVQRKTCPRRGRSRTGARRSRSDTQIRAAAASWAEVAEALARGATRWGVVHRGRHSSRRTIILGRGGQAARHRLRGGEARHRGDATTMTDGGRGAPATPAYMSRSKSAGARLAPRRCPQERVLRVGV